MSKDDFTTWLRQTSGVKDITKAPLPKIREAARHLYKAYVAATYSKYSPFYIASKLDSPTIEKFLKDTITLNKRYDVFYDTIDYDLSNASMDEHIQTDSLLNYKSVFSDIYKDPNAKAKKAPATKRAPVRRAAPKKTTRRAPAPTAKKSIQIDFVTDDDGSDDAVAAPKRGKTLAKKAPAKPKVKAKGCKDYLVKDLRTLASTLKVRGSSKMSKAELCEALGI